MNQNIQHQNNKNIIMLKSLLSTMAPGYLKLAASGELRKRLKRLKAKLENCTLCPRECGVDRTGGDEGFCQMGTTLTVSGTHPHFGEEAPLVGSHGSGTRPGAIGPERSEVSARPCTPPKCSGRTSFPRP